MKHSHDNNKKRISKQAQIPAPAHGAGTQNQINKLAHTQTHTHAANLPNNMIEWTHGNKINQKTNNAREKEIKLKPAKKISRWHNN